jgi:hypothetical protein
VLIHAFVRRDIRVQAVKMSLVLEFRLQIHQYVLEEVIVLPQTLVLVRCHIMERHVRMLPLPQIRDQVAMVFSILIHLFVLDVVNVSVQTPANAMVDFSEIGVNY